MYDRTVRNCRLPVLGHDSHADEIIVFMESSMIPSRLTSVVYYLKNYLHEQFMLSALRQVRVFECGSAHSAKRPCTAATSKTNSQSSWVAHTSSSRCSAPPTLSSRTGPPAATPGRRRDCGSPQLVVVPKQYQPPQPHERLQCATHSSTRRLTQPRGLECSRQVAHRSVSDLQVFSGVAN